jgi:hypothetical protein
MSETNGRAISPATPITIGLVVLVLTVSGGAIFKAGQVLTELDYFKTGMFDVKTDIKELRADVAEMKRVLYRLDRQPSTAGGK